MKFIKVVAAAAAALLSPGAYVAAQAEDPSVDVLRGYASVGARELMLIYEGKGENAKACRLYRDWERIMPTLFKRKDSVSCSAYPTEPMIPGHLELYTLIGAYTLSQGLRPLEGGCPERLYHKAAVATYNKNYGANLKVYPPGKYCKPNRLQDGP